MELQDILSVGLTAEDFDVVLEGLEAIPEKAHLTEMMAGTTGMLLGSLGNDSRRKEMERDMEKKMKEVIARNDARREDLTILKSKVILLKRLLLTNARVREAQDILNKK